MSRETFRHSGKSGGVLNTHVALTTMSAYGISTLTLTLVYTVAMGAHHAPADEPSPLLPRKRFYLGLRAARATRLLSLILSLSLSFFPLLRDYMELAGIVLLLLLLARIDLFAR